MSITVRYPKCKTVLLKTLPRGQCFMFNLNDECAVWIFLGLESPSKTSPGVARVRKLVQLPLNRIESDRDCAITVGENSEVFPVVVTDVTVIPESA